MSNNHKEFLDTCQFFIVFGSKNDSGQIDAIWHIIGYVNRPSEKEVDNAYIELSTDEEFGITDIARKLSYRIFTRSEMEKYMPEVLEG